jgi:NMD protein affecting ribosome stability and mRNA decay
MNWKFWKNKQVNKIHVDLSVMVPRCVDCKFDTLDVREGQERVYIKLCAALGYKPTEEVWNSSECKEVFTLHGNRKDMSNFIVKTPTDLDTALMQSKKKYCEARKEIIDLRKKPPICETCGKTVDAVGTSGQCAKCLLDDIEGKPTPENNKFTYCPKCSTELKPISFAREPFDALKFMKNNRDQQRETLNENI